MERKKLFVRVGIGVAGALLLVGIFAVANAVGDSNAMRRGIDEGFELRGTYQGDPGRDGIGTIAFQTLDGEPSWEASKAPGAHVKGAFKETVDPNIYVLEDESGNGVGWVHLAYSDAQGAGSEARTGAPERTSAGVSPCCRTKRTSIWAASSRVTAQEARKAPPGAPLATPVWSHQPTPGA